MQALARQSLRGQVLSRSLVQPVAAVQARHVSTQSLSQADNLALLNEQRAKRPSSPWHIYQPQLTSISSIANRATGAGLSVGFYGIFLAHLAGVDSTTMLDTFASLPGWMQLSTKALIAGPAAYHTLNGFRHLGWDTGYFLNLKTSYMAGYVVLGATAVSTAGLLAL
ncbi:succinate dehydrogenase cytochrome b subunit SDH3 [Sporobolomyces koalae]|uniref:succinate dehydrogenase cytochrome b subunit SDH3 n=1 Tax=Sporobolomyces koalae TaxID=500713 RepID=UPI00317062AF